WPPIFLPCVRRLVTDCVTVAHLTNTKLHRALKATQLCQREDTRSAHQSLSAGVRASRGCGMCGVSAPGGRKMALERFAPSGTNRYGISSICPTYGNPAPKVGTQWALEGALPREPIPFHRSSKSSAKISTNKI